MRVARKLRIALEILSTLIHSSSFLLHSFDKIRLSNMKGN